MPPFGAWPEPRVIATGLGFPEGPVYLGRGEIAFTELQGGCVARSDGSPKTVLATTGGGPNGATLDGADQIWVANNGGINLGPGGYWFASDPIDGRIQKITTGGDCIDVSGDLDGEPPHRPNDLCFGPDGNLYFTDPANWEDLQNLKPGRLWRLDPATGASEVLSQIPLFCNGISFGPDPSFLYVAQTIGMKVLEVGWTPKGLGAPREWATMPSGFPDGLCFSADGDCYVCGAMGDVLQVFGPDGTVKHTIEFPAHSEPTNCCLGDGVLYVTCSGSGEVLAFDLGVEALPLYPFRS